jgi:hypothetical protein
MNEANALGVFLEDMPGHGKGLAELSEADSTSYHDRETIWP